MIAGGDESRFSKESVISNAGGFITFHAFDSQLEQQVTVRAVSIAALETRGLMDKFNFEISIFRELDHPAIAKLLEVYRDETRIYLILEFFPNGNLTSFLMKNETPDLAVTKQMFSQIISGVAFCHERGLPCPWITPDNVFVAVDGSAKLANFGSLFVDKCFLYCAPEVSENPDYDWWMADMWSLGVLLCTMVTRELPWRSAGNDKEIDRARLVMPQTIPPLIAQIIVGCVTIQPERRWTIQNVKKSRWLSEKIGVDKANTWSQLATKKVFKPRVMNLSVSKMRKL